MFVENIKTYIKLIIQEGLLKVPSELLNEITEWVLGMYAKHTIETFLMSKLRDLHHKRETFEKDKSWFLNEIERSKRNLRSILKNDEENELFIAFAHSEKITFKEKAKIENIDDDGNLRIFTDNEEWEVNANDEHSINNFLKNYEELALESYDITLIELNDQIDKTIKLLPALKTYSQKIPGKLSDYSPENSSYYFKNFKYKDITFTVFLQTFPKYGESGHYNPDSKHIQINIGNYKLKDSDFYTERTIQKNINEIKDTVSHELRHFIQFNEKNIKIGLPPKKIRTKDADIHGNPIKNISLPLDKNDKHGRIEHSLRDIEFQTNNSSNLYEIKPILSKIPEEYRTPVFKLLIGQKIQAPFSLTTTKKKYANKIYDFDQFMKGITVYSKNELMNTRTYNNFKKLKEFAPEKYKRAARDLYRAISDEMNMGNILTDPEYIETIKQSLEKLKANNAFENKKYYSLE